MGLIRVRGAGRRGFTLIELMVVVGIIGIVAVVAVPSFQKYLFESWEAEGTKILLEAYRDQQRFSQERPTNLEVKEFVGSVDITQLYYRVANPKFNLIVGNLGDASADPGCAPGTKNTSFKSIGLYANCPENKFGYSQTQNNPATGRPLYAMGVEGSYRESNALHVMMIDEIGRIFLLCDAFTKLPGPGASFYPAYGGGEPVCERGAGGGGGFGGGGTGP